jgi:hypothetical protein
MKTNNGKNELEHFEKQTLNYEIKTHDLPEWLLQSIHNTECLKTWTLKLYESYLYKIRECLLNNKELKC